MHPTGLLGALSKKDYYEYMYYKNRLKKDENIFFGGKIKNIIYHVIVIFEFTEQ